MNMTIQAFMLTILIEAWEAVMDFIEKMIALWELMITLRAVSA